MSKHILKGLLFLAIMGLPVFAAVDSNEMMSAVQNSATTIKPVLMIIFVIVELGILFGGGITAMILKKQNGPWVQALITTIVVFILGFTFIPKVIGGTAGTVIRESGDAVEQMLRFN